MPWNTEDLRLDDPINEEIWADSPGIQDQIHNRNNNEEFEGEVGCQQAMVGDADFGFQPLPWVPDLAGKDYGKNNSLLIIGSAYAPFLSRYGGGRNAIPRRAYKWASAFHVSEFQKLFLEEVVGTDRAYYSKLKQLTNDIAASELICLTDLCKGSFVKGVWDEVNPQTHAPHFFTYEVARKFNGGDPVVRETAQSRGLFTQYTLNAWPWTVSRLRSAHTVLVLGYLAEIALIKLLVHHEAALSISTGENLDLQDNFADADLLQGAWLEHHRLQPLRSMDFWLDSFRWWNADIDGHRLRIVPVFHPCARFNWTNDYQVQLRNKLTTMFA